MGEFGQTEPVDPSMPEPEAPVEEEGQKYDGGEIPRHELSDEDE